MTADEAVKEWATQQLAKWGITPKEIISVNFGIDDNGSCETCSSPYGCVEIGYKQGNGHTKYDTCEPEGGLTKMFEEIHQIMVG